MVSTTVASFCMKDVDVFLTLNGVSDYLVEYFVAGCRVCIRREKKPLKQSFYTNVLTCTLPRL